jgi:small subunit ribosomal protein S20
VANIKSQIKRNRSNEAARVRNKAVRSELKTQAKKVRAAAATGSSDAAEALLVATRDLDKAASKGVMHKRAAARRKSRLARSVNAAG